MVTMVPVAAAQTFCVRGTGDAPGCGAATQQPTIQAAVDAAAGSAGTDLVRLQGKLPAQGFTIGAGNVVEVDGTDADALTITASEHDRDSRVGRVDLARGVRASRRRLRRSRLTSRPGR